MAHIDLVSKTGKRLRNDQPQLLAMKQDVRDMMDTGKSSPPKVSKKWGLNCLDPIGP